MTYVTSTIPVPEGNPAAPATARIPEPSMFDSSDWLTGNALAPEPGPKFAGVRFQQVGRIYTYIADGFTNLKVGDWVIVDTQRGRQMGQVATLKRPRNLGDINSFKHIERLSTGRDMAIRHYYENKELEAMIACRAESNALNLPIKIVKAEYSFDGLTLTFLFSSDQEERVETNDLRQVMSRLYRARIETRQISPREVAKIIGGMGACGIEQRCCSRFLTDFSPISIKHAKEQGLSLNPHDITGMCGRLRCCLIYEYEQYVEARRLLPKKNAIVGTPSGQGKVIDLLPMRDSVLVLVGEGETAKGIVVHREQIIPLEELKRLQEKAASGTCDKHEGGNCDCGKSKPAQTAEAAAAPESHPIDSTEAALAAAIAESAGPATTPAGDRKPDASAWNLKRKKKDKGPARSGGSAPEIRAAGQRTDRPPRAGRPQQDNRESRGTPQVQPTQRAGKPQPEAWHNRHTQIRPKHQRERFEQPHQQGANPPIGNEPHAPTDAVHPANQSEPTRPLNSAETEHATRPLRRPLRRPIPHQTPQQPDNPEQPTQES